MWQRNKGDRKAAITLSAPALGRNQINVHCREKRKRHKRRKSEFLLWFFGPQ
jgi:hypothetical protein